MKVCSQVLCFLPKLKHPNSYSFISQAQFWFGPPSVFICFPSCCSSRAALGAHQAASTRAVEVSLRGELPRAGHRVVTSGPAQFRGGGQGPSCKLTASPFVTSAAKRLNGKHSTLSSIARDPKPFLRGVAWGGKGAAPALLSQPSSVCSSTSGMFYQTLHHKCCGHSRVTRASLDCKGRWALANWFQPDEMYLVIALGCFPVPTQSQHCSQQYRMPVSPLPSHPETACLHALWPYISLLWLSWRSH